MIELADSHGHLTMVFPGPEARWPTRAATDDEVAELVSRARDAGVTRILVPATTLEDAPRAVEVAERFDGVYAAVGVHPHETKAFDEDRVIPALERLAASAKVVAIGEIGLDYFYDFAPKDDQKRALVAQLKLAERLGKPVLLHNRESEDDLLAILEAEAKGSPERLRGVFHSFCASTATGEKAISLGYLVSYSGMITFRMAENVRESAAALPLDVDARRDRRALPRPGALPRQAERARVRGAHGGEARGGEGGLARRGRGRVTTANFRRLFGTP